MARTRRPIKYATPRTPKQKAIRITFHVLVWFGAAILYYVGFSLFFDTPVEYELKHSTDQLRDEYTRLEARYDSLRTVMENVSERDRNVFNILFESDPTISTPNTKPSGSQRTKACWTNPTVRSSWNSKRRSDNPKRR